MEPTVPNTENTNLTTDNPQPVKSQSTEKPKLKKPFNKKLLIVTGVVLLVVFVLTFALIRNRPAQDTERTTGEKATSLQENLILATVGGEEIKVSDLNHFAASNLGERKLDSETLKGMLDVLVERKLLDQEAAVKNISIVPPDGVKNENYYSLLRIRVTQGIVSSAEVIDIGWWLPPLGEYEQTELSQRQRAEQEQASLDIEQRLINNVPTEQILEYVSQTYSALAESLSINGSKYEGPGSLAPDVLVRTHELSAELLYLPRYQAIFQMNTGEVSKNIWEDGSGADIIKAISVNRGEGESYEQWLDRNISEKVTYSQSIIDSL